MTTKDDIRAWAGKANTRYMVVVCDTFSYEDFPVYIDRENFEKTLLQYTGRNMCRIMEVYDLELDIEMQLQEPRAYHPPEI